MTIRCDKCGAVLTPERDEAHDRDICERIVKQGNCIGINCVDGDDCPFMTEDAVCRLWPEMELIAARAKVWLKAHPKTSPILTVRIKKHNYTLNDKLGEILKVIQSNENWYEDINDHHCFPTHAGEVIPPYDKTTHRLRRKWGKYEEFIGEGDLASTSDGSWVATTHNPGDKQESLCIYITPITLKPATPDPSADCLPSIQEVKYLIGSIKQALQAFPGDSMFTETAVGLRYGTIRDLLAIMLNDAEGMGRSWEMKKESE